MNGACWHATPGRPNLFGFTSLLVIGELSPHRVRQGFVKARTPQAGRCRREECLRRSTPALIEDAENRLSDSFPLLIRPPLDRPQALQEQASEFEVQIKTWHRASEVSQRLEKVPGIGPLTVTALVTSVGDAQNFDNGLQFAAWQDVIPRRHASSGKPTLPEMSKRGDQTGRR